MPKLPVPSVPALPVPISPEVARLALIALRGGVTGLWLAPDKIGGLAGLSSKKTPNTSLMVRWFAIREAALATLLATAAPEQRALQLTIGVVVDAVDTAAAALALKKRDMPLRGAITGTLGAAGAVALGVIALSGEKKKR